MCVFFVITEARGQTISGTFSISKISPSTGIEKITFNGDGTADVIYGYQIRKVVPGTLGFNFERVTTEVRGKFRIETIEERIAKWEAKTSTDELAKLLEQMKQSKVQGYDAVVTVILFDRPSNTERAYPFRRKGSELINIITNEIFRKPFWSF